MTSRPTAHIQGPTISLGLLMATGTCEVCGDQGDIERHHIIGQQSIKRIQPGEHGHDLDLLNKPENLIILCIPCHRLTDSHQYRRWWLRREGEIKGPSNPRSRPDIGRKMARRQRMKAQCNWVIPKTGKRCGQKNRQVALHGGFCRYHRAKAKAKAKSEPEPEHQDSPMPPLHGWSEDEWEEPILDGEEMAALTGIHKLGEEVDDYVLELFAEWPEVWKRRWLYLEEW